MGASSESRKSVQRNRIKYNQEQLEKLERVFLNSQYPDTYTMETLAMDLDVTLDRISIWFQNRRSKFKRQSKDNHVSWMRNQIFNGDVTSTTCQKKNSQDRKHVLSAPAFGLQRHAIAWERPTSNLHYLPTVPASPPFLDQFSDLHQSPPLPSCPSSPDVGSYPHLRQHSLSESPRTPVMNYPVNDQSLHVDGFAYHTNPYQTSSSCVFANAYNPTMPVYPTSCSFPSMAVVPQLSGM